MKFHETLRAYRKQSGLSQEKLAELLNVSRQAITKWESGNGMPDLLNLKAISKLYNISVDTLLSDDDSDLFVSLRPYTSMVEYDIDDIKHFDIVLGSVRQVIVRAVEGEKLNIELASDSITHLDELVKVKIDDIRRRIDVEMKRAKTVSPEKFEQHMDVYLRIPKKYMGDTELAAHCEKLVLFDITAERFEVDGNTREVRIEGGRGHIELNSNKDMDIYMSDYMGRIDINQISASSRIYIPRDYDFEGLKKGIRTQLLFEEDGVATEPFSVPDADNKIEINGMNSKLTIVRI